MPTNNGRTQHFEQIKRKKERPSGRERAISHCFIIIFIGILSFHCMTPKPSYLKCHEISLKCKEIFLWIKKLENSTTPELFAFNLISVGWDRQSTTPQSMDLVHRHVHIPTSRRQRRYPPGSALLEKAHRSRFMSTQSALECCTRANNTGKINSTYRCVQQMNHIQSGTLPIHV